MDENTETISSRDWKSLKSLLNQLSSKKASSSVVAKSLSNGKRKYWESLLESGQDFEACEQWAAAEVVYQKAKAGLEALRESQPEETVSVELNFESVSKKLEEFYYQDTVELLNNVSEALPIREQEHFQEVVQKSQAKAKSTNGTPSAELENSKPELVGIRKVNKVAPKTREELYQIRVDITNKSQHYQKVKKTPTKPIVSKDKWPEQVGAYNSLNTFSRVMDYLSKKDPVWVQDLYEYFGTIQELKQLFTKNS